MRSQANNQKIPLEINTLLKEAWKLTDGLKWPTFKVLVPCLLIESIIAFLHMHQQGLLRHIDSIIILLVSWYARAIITTFTVHKTMGLTLTVGAAIDRCIDLILPLLALCIIYNVILLAASLLFLPIAMISKPLAVLAFIILIGFIIYLVGIMFAFSIPILLLSKCKTYSALLVGWHAAKPYWIPLICSELAVSGLIILSALPFGIGLIWTIPMFYALNAIWFREILGGTLPKQ